MKKQNKPSIEKIKEEYNLFLNPIEDKFEKDIREFLTNQGKKISEEYQEKYPETIDKELSENLTEDLADERTLNLTNWESELNDLFRMMVFYYIESGAAGESLTNKLYFNNEKQFDISRENVDAVLTIEGVRATAEAFQEVSLWESHLNWIDENGALQAKRITESTMTICRDEIQKGIKEKLNSADIATRIASKTEELAKTRARTIALTETHNAVMAVTEENYKINGFEYHEWLDVGDAFVRDSHVNVSGEIVMIGEMFSNGLLRPGDTSAPPAEVVNCRCFTAPATRMDYLNQ